MPPIRQSGDPRRVCTLGESSAFLQETGPQSDGGMPPAPEAPNQMSGYAEDVRLMRTLPLLTSRLAAKDRGVRQFAGTHVILTGTLRAETYRGCGWACGTLISCVSKVVEPTVIVPERVLL